MACYREVWAVFPPVDVSVGCYLGYGEKKVGKTEDLISMLKNSNINRGGVA